MTEYINFTHNNFISTIDSINCKNFDISIAGKQLFINTSLIIQPNTIYGLIGKNGSGKSTLLKQIYSMQQNSINNSMKINTLYVEQEILLDTRNPIDFILDSNSKLKKTQDELNAITILLENEDIKNKDYNILNEKSKELYEIINIWNPELEKSLAIRILKGLGFTDKMLEQSSTYLSGGWCMRLSLARSLYLRPDLLLLDEPTNHLDLEAIIWISDYLNTWNKTVIVVSHNIGFLNDTCDYIINIENMKLVYYKGNYNAFKECLKNTQTEIKNKWDKYEKQLKDIKKKGVKNNIIEFEKKNKAIKPELLYSIYINFDLIPIINGNIISVENMSFSYKDNSILENISCGIDMNSKIVLVGKNGSGKSTFVNLLIRVIEPTKGSIYINPQARIGYYSQHFESYLPSDKTPVEYIMSTLNVDINCIYQYFGKIKLDKISYNKPIHSLSGGQKARVALVKLILMQPHLLILDEPTNHLDIETVDALIKGLINYNGGILIITHETDLIKKLDKTIWMLDPDSKNIMNIESYNEYVRNL
jgi:ATP-binding cassette subfamily F protein 1